MRIAEADSEQKPRYLLVALPDKESRSFRHTRSRRVATIRRGILLFLITTITFISGGLGATPQTSSSAVDLFGNPLEFICGFNDPFGAPAPAPWPGLAGFMAEASPAGGAAGPIGFIGRDSFDRYTQPYGGQAVTAEEWYGTAGLYWRSSNYEKIDGVCLGGVVREVIGLISGFWWILVSIQGSIGLNVMELVTSATPFQWFLNSVGEVLKEMNNRLYLPFLMPIVMIGALWMGWQGLVLRRSSQATQAAVWMIAATCAGFVFLGNPKGIAEATNDVVVTVQTTIIGTVASVGTPEGEGPCTLSGDVERKSARVIRCSLWYTFLFVPWSEGQFGAANGNLTVKGFYAREDGQLWVPYNSGNAPKIGNGKSLWNISGDTGDGSGIPIEWLQLDTLTWNHDEVINGDTSSRDAKTNQWYAITQRLAKSTEGNGVPPPPNTPESGGNLLDYEVPEDAIITPGAEEWSGANVTHRFQVAILALVAMIAGAGPVMFLSLILLVQEVGFIFLLLFAPIFLLLGVHPGAGRRMLLNWFEQILNLSLKRIGNAAILAVLMALIGSVVSSGATWFLQVFMIICVSAASLVFRKRIIDSMSRVNLGGAGGDFSQQATGALRRVTNQTVNQASNTASTLAGGGGGGGLLGTVVGGAIAGAGASGLVNAARKQGDDARVDDSGNKISKDQVDWFDNSVVGQAEREETEARAEARLRNREEFAMDSFSGTDAEVAGWADWANKYGTVDKETGEFIPRAIPRPKDERLAQILRDNGIALFEDIQEEYDALLAAAEEHSLTDAQGNKIKAPVEYPTNREVYKRLKSENMLFAEEVSQHAEEMKAWSDKSATTNAEGIRVPAPVPVHDNPHINKAYRDAGITRFVDKDGGVYDSTQVAPTGQVVMFGTADNAVIDRSQHGSGGGDQTVQVGPDLFDAAIDQAKQAQQAAEKSRTATSSPLLEGVPNVGRTIEALNDEAKRKSEEANRIDVEALTAWRNRNLPPGNGGG